jgi:hypothetical protein
MRSKLTPVLAAVLEVEKEKDPVLAMLYSTKGFI